MPFRNKNQDRQEIEHHAMSDEEIRYAIEACQKYRRERVTEFNIAVEEAKAQVKAEAKRETAKAMRDLGRSEDIVLKSTGLRFADL